MNIQKLNGLIIDLCQKDNTFLKKSEIKKNNKKLERLKHIKSICEYYKGKNIFERDLKNTNDKINNILFVVDKIKDKNEIKRIKKEYSLKDLKQRKKELEFIINELF